jgi:sporulation protein YlmC with PRC-barrel domain
MLKHSKTLRDRVAVIGVASAFAFSPLVISPVVAQTLNSPSGEPAQIVESEENSLSGENANPDAGAVDSFDSDDTATETLDLGSDRMATEDEAQSGNPLAQGASPDADSDMPGTESNSLSQDDGAVTNDDSLASDPDAQESVDGVDPMTSASIPSGEGEIYVLEQSEDQVMANHYIGKAVYNDAQEKVGDIRDLVFSMDGGIEAAVIGVGGFLGLGQKQVAVRFEEIRIIENPETAELELYISANKDQLAEAPEFTTKEDKLAEMRSNDAGTEVDDPANPMAPAAPATQPTE